MRIIPAHYDYIKAAVLGNPHAPTLPDYLARGLTEKRWRWDLLWAAKISPWISANVYPYANDEHIDTALRKILRTPEGIP